MQWRHMSSKTKRGWPWQKTAATVLLMAAFDVATAASASQLSVVYQTPNSGDAFSGTVVVSGGLIAERQSPQDVFLLTPGAKGQPYTRTLIHDFGQPAGDGTSPSGNMILDTHGNVWGTTDSGGANASGIVFELVKPAMKRGAWTYVNVASMPAEEHGRSIDGLAFDKKGDLLGAELQDCNTADYSIFLVPKATLAGGTKPITKVYNAPADCTLTVTPSLGLTIDGAGNLYGVSNTGGTANLGAIFEVSPPVSKHAAWTGQVIYSFCAVEDQYGECPDGTQPQFGVALGPNGSLYGVSRYDGGGFPCGPGSGICTSSGTVWQAMPPSGGNAWTLQVLHVIRQVDANENPTSEYGVQQPNTRTFLLPSGILAFETLTGPADPHNSCDAPQGAILGVNPANRATTIINSQFGQNSCLDGPTNDLPYLSMDSKGTLYGEAGQLQINEPNGQEAPPVIFQVTTP